MKKRGPITSMVGMGMILISFVIIQSILPNANPTMSTELVIPTLLEGMFDQTSDEIQLYPDESNTFSFTTTTTQVPLLWGLQINDFQQGDALEITLPDGNNNVIQILREPFTFEMFVIEEIDTYDFDIKNIGKRPASVIMMFSEDPENSPAMTDPNSALMNTIVPLVASGVLLMVGVILVAIGIVLSVYDWKRGTRTNYT